MGRPGRRKPYTATGITRLSCSRCGAPASTQWNVCADGNLFRPLCLKCDIALNRMVLKWMRDPEADRKIEKYKLIRS